MSQFVLFVVLGLATGAVYALAGVGLVLTYRTSGVFNFGHGAIATVAAYLFYTQSVQHGLPWPVAAVLSIIVLGTLIGLVLELWARRARRVPLSTQIAGTVGILLAVEAIATLVYPTDVTRSVPPFVNGSVPILGAPLQWSEIATLIFTLVVTGAISGWLRYTRIGMATRAVVEDDELVSLTAINPNRVRRVAWVIGSMLACASGVLFAPLLPLDPLQLTLLVVAAFGAVAIGRFANLPMTCLGGLLIGVLAALATRYVTSESLSGLSPTIPFLVLFLVIITMPRARARSFDFHVNVSHSPHWVPPARLQGAGALVTIVILAIVPTFAGVHLTDWSVSLGYVVLFLSLGLLVRTSGQVSLCHVTFLAIGAVGMAHLTGGSLHLPWFPALLLSGLIAVPVGVVLAVPAIRLTGLFLALATFGFGILVQYLFYPASYMFGNSGSSLPIPQPAFFGTGDRSYYYLSLLLMVAASLFTLALTRGRMGRLLRGVAEGPTTTASTGAFVAMTRITVFCVSAFMASVAGGMIASGLGSASQDSYGPLLSLTFFALIVIVVGREPWSALIAGLSLTLIPSYFPSFSISVYLQLAFGVSAIALTVAPQAALPGWLTARLDAVFGSGRLRPRAGATPDLELAPRSRGVGSPTGLEASGVMMRFGGVVAVSNVTLRAPMGVVTGLIGPNGAGKTTLFNVCSGLARPQRGHVRLNGRDVTRHSMASRARAGLGRTFQQMQLFESLTVEQTVALGREGHYAGWNPASHLISTRTQMRSVRESTARAVQLCDLGALANTPIRLLSTGQRRLVDLARCIAGGYDVILLDEPSSGLNDGETQKMAEVLRRIVAEEGVGILLVEHDMSLVLDLCSHIYVLDFGELIVEGPPATIRDSPTVHSVYLGRDTDDSLVTEGAV